MKKTNLIIIVLLILIVALGTAIYLQYYRPAQQEDSVATQPVPPAEPEKKPIVHYPVPEKAVAAEEQEEETPAAEPQQQAQNQPPLPETLPEVGESDQSIREALESLFTGQALYKLLFMENFIQRFVATVDNLPDKQMPRAHLPIKPPGGIFLVSGTNDAPQTSSRNDQRYAPYTEMLESLNQDLVVKIYVHFYPLFQEAYEQLGYKNAYFNDRLVYVIDHLLKTPNPADPLLLAQPGVLYTYADPLLEKRSAGQKLLLRIGQKQRTRVIEVLKGYRQKLTTLDF